MKDTILLELFKVNEVYGRETINLSDFSKLTLSDLDKYKPTVTMVIDELGLSCYRNIGSFGLPQFEAVFCTKGKCILDKEVVDRLTSYNNILAKYGTLNNKSITLQPFKVYTTVSKEVFIYLGKVEITKSVGYYDDSEFRCLSTVSGTKQMRLKFRSDWYRDFKISSASIYDLLSNEFVIPNYTTCNSKPKLKERFIESVTQLDTSLLPTTAEYNRVSFIDSYISEVTLNPKTMKHGIVKHQLVIKYTYKYLDLKE